MKWVLKISVFFLLLSAIGCGGGMQGTGTSSTPRTKLLPVSGAIQDTNGSAVAGVAVTAELNGVPVAATESDANGQFATNFYLNEIDILSLKFGEDIESKSLGAVPTSVESISLAVLKKASNSYEIAVIDVQVPDKNDSSDPIKNNDSSDENNTSAGNHSSGSGGSNDGNGKTPPPVDSTPPPPPSGEEPPSLDPPPVEQAQCFNCGYSNDLDNEPGDGGTMMAPPSGGGGGEGTSNQGTSTDGGTSLEDVITVGVTPVDNGQAVGGGHGGGSSGGSGGGNGGGLTGGGATLGRGSF